MSSFVAHNAYHAISSASEVDFTRAVTAVKLITCVPIDAGFVKVTPRLAVHRMFNPVSVNPCH
jgi:hypothetical protein